MHFAGKLLCPPWIDRRQSSAHLCYFACKVDNEALASEDKVCLQLHVPDTKKGWKHSVSGLTIEEGADAAAKLTNHLRDGVADSIYDFDDHFADIAKDWRNQNVV